MHNDTIVDFCYEYDTPQTDVFYMESCNDRPFLFLDVTFDGRKALLIRKDQRDRVIITGYSASEGTPKP